MQIKCFLAVFITFISSSVSAEIISQNDCGTNCSYTLDTETGLLRVYPTNPNEPYADIATMYSGFRSNTSVKKLIVEEGITNINWGAFEHETNLESVVLPDSLNTVDGNIFSYDSKLTTITIPDIILNVTNANSFYTSQLTTIYCSGSGDLSKCNDILETMHA